MRKTIPTLFLALLTTLTAAAQSGRRIAPPAQPARDAAAEPDPPPAARPEPSAHVAAASRGGSGLAFVPEGVMTRELRNLKGEPFRLADYAGKVVVLNLWATWCGPCRRELPEFEEVRRDYAGRGVEFLALTTEDPAADGERVRKFVNAYKLGSRVGWIDRPTARVLMDGHNVIPQTLVISPDGRVVRHMRGYAPRRSAENLRDALDLALEK
jgi:thiol-disulfide isomerase/thioredoxin